MKILIFKTVFLQSQTKRSETNCLNGMQTSWEVIWIHRAKEEFESEEGKELLKSLGIEGEYAEGAKRKDNWVYYVE